MYTRPFLVSAVTVRPLRVIFPALNSTRLRGSRLPSLAPPNRAIPSPFLQHAVNRFTRKFEISVLQSILRYFRIAVQRSVEAKEGVVSGLQMSDPPSSSDIVRLNVGGVSSVCECDVCYKMDELARSVLHCTWLARLASKTIARGRLSKMTYTLLARRCL